MKTFIDIMNESIEAMEKLIENEDDLMEYFQKYDMDISINICQNTISKYQLRIDAHKFAILVYNTTEIYKGEK